ncbi:MAG: hypothetical protein ABI746_04985 [Dermatophilaceae bacterium]
MDASVWGQGVAWRARRVRVSELSLKKTDVEDGHRPGVTDADHVELRDLKKRNKLLEQGNEVLHRAAANLSQASLPRE